MDIDKFSAWAAIVVLFGSGHATAPDNLGWYYNSATGLFEPILYDVHRSPLGHWQGPYREAGITKSFDGIVRSSLVSRILSQPKIQLQRNKTLWRIVNDKSLNADDLTAIEYEKIRPFIPKGFAGERFSNTDVGHLEGAAVLRENRQTVKRWLAFSRVFVGSSLESRPGTRTVVFRFIPDFTETL